jgi:microcystin-dependent protein
MGLETFEFIDSLNPNNPAGADSSAQGDDHIRGTKKAVQDSFPAITGPVTAGQADLNLLAGAAAGGSPLCPIGCVLPYMGAVAPDGWLPCDGSAIPGEHTDLIALVGANTPDMEGQFLRGWSTDAAVDPSGPRAAGSTQGDDNKAHTHLVVGSLNDGGSTNFDRGDVTNLANQTTSSSGGTEARPKNMTVMLIIKY